MTHSEPLENDFLHLPGDDFEQTIKNALEHFEDELKVYFKD